MVSRVCFQCGKEPQGAETLKKCGRCKSVEYCGLECQKLSWNTHKLACPILKSFLPIPDGDEFVCDFYDPAEREVVHLSQDQFFQKTGIRFVRSNFASPLFVAKHVDKLVPEAEVADCSDSICLTVQEGMGHGVMAKNAIPDGALICQWVGAIQSGPAPRYASGVYRRDAMHGLAIDPSRKGNLAGLINDGPPNCAPVPGGGQRIYIKASRPIRANEMLYNDYGPDHAIKLGPYRIADDALESMIDYCSKHDPYNPKTPYELGMTLYMFGTFAAFMKLHLIGTLSARKTLENLKTNHLFKALANQGLFAKFYPGFLEGIHKLRKNPDFLERLDQFGSGITSRAYCQSLLILLSAEITEERIAACREFAEFNDQLYLWSNGALVSTYIDRPDEPTDDPFPVSDLKASFLRLGPEMRKQALKQIDGHINYQNERDLNLEIGMRKAKALAQLKEELAQLEDNKELT